MVSNFRFLTINENALKVLGLSRNDLIGNRVDELNSSLISRLSIPDVFKEIQVNGEVQREFVVTRQNEDYHYRVRLIPTVFDNRQEGMTVIGEDITEQIRFEERLMISEARFRAIVEDQTDFICRWRPDGTITFINESLSRYLGISCKIIYGQSIFSYIFSEDHNLAHERISQINKNKQGLSTELRILDRTGQYRWHQWITRGIYDNNGTLIECQSVGRDITELKESQEALRQSELLYRTILENIQDMYYRSDKDGNLIMASPSGAKMLGYDSLQGLIGKNIAETFYQSSQERKQFLDILYREKKVADHEITLKKRDGSTVIISANSQLLYDTAGNITGVEGFCRNITLRKQIERAHFESEERYRNVVEDQTEFICRFTPDGTHIFVNEAYCRYFGLKREELLGTRFQPVIHPEDLEKVTRLFASLTQEHPVEAIDQRIIMSDSSIRWQRWSDRAIFHADGSLKEYQSVGRDITVRKHAEEALVRKNDELHAVNEQLAAADEKLKAQFDALTKSERITRINEERLLMAQEIGHTASWEYDLVTNKVWGSAEGPRIYGFTPGDGEFSIEDLEECIPDRERVHQALVDLITEGKEFDLECSVIPRDGSAQKMIHSVARLEKDAQGNPLKVMGIIQDITVRKQLEENGVAALKRAREQQAALGTIAFSPYIFSGDVHGLSASLTEISSRVLGVERVSVWLFNSNGDELQCIDLYEVSCDRHSSGNVLKRHEYIHEFDALSTAKYIDADDPLTDPRTAGYIEGYLKPNRITSMLDAVIRVTGQNLGVICFEHVDRPHHWDSDEIAFACQLADQVAITLMNHNRRQIDLALLESEERYRNVVEDQTELICRFTPDGIITFVNDAYCRYFGLNKKTCVGSPHVVLLPDEDAGLMKQHLASLTTENSTGTIEHRIVLPDGKIRWQFWMDCAFFNADRTVTEYQSVGFDTTEKHEQTQKIRESEERFRMITELSPFPISFIDISGNYRYLNKKFEQLFGYTITDIPTGKDWFLKAFPDITVRTNAIQTWKQDRNEDCDLAKLRLFPVTCKDGSVRQIHFCPITLTSGEQFVVYEDLTDKTESDRLRSVLASIVNSSNDAIIGKKLDGTIMSWNKAAERYYGYLAEEVIGKPIDIIVPTELRDQVPLFHRRVATGETIERFDTVRIRKDGARIEVCVTLSPIKDEEGQIIGISTIAQNIAEKKKSEVSRIFRQLHRR